MPKIFISYRREDSQYQADRLYEALKQYVIDPKRDIFIDVDNIPVGVDFVDHLESQVAQCDILLAIIGPGWLTAKNAATGMRRLDDPKDFVRIEIAAALLRGIPVAPVLLDGTPFPAEYELPDDLKPLVRRNGADVRRVSFDVDVRRLIHGIGLGRVTHDQNPQSTVGDTRIANAATSEVASATGRMASAPQTHAAIPRIIVLAGVFLVLAGALLWLANPGDWRRVTAQAPGVESSSRPPATLDPDRGIWMEASDSGAAQALRPGATQLLGECGTVTAIIYFESREAILHQFAQSILDTAIRKTFDCSIDSVEIDAYPDRGGSEAEVQNLAELRAKTIAAVFTGVGIEERKIKRSVGDLARVSVNVSSLTSTPAKVTLLLSPVAKSASISESAVGAAISSAIEHDISAGKVFNDCKECPQMVAIPSGTFTMGSPETEVGRDYDEGPQRSVSIPAFAAGRYEVTVAEWNACVAAGSCPSLPGYLSEDGVQPAASITWMDASAYTRWLSQRTGHHYRLLTESEWEFAARANSATTYSWGSDPESGCSYANGADSTVLMEDRDWTSALPCSDGVGGRTAKVGSYQPNGFGLYDMHGNVAEMVQDCYARDYSERQPSDGRAFLPLVCPSHVARGGGYSASQRGLRSADRWQIFNDSGGGGVIGFRVARSVP